MISLVSPEKFSQIQRLFLEVCDLPAPDQSTHLELRCDGDRALYTTVKALLQEDWLVEGNLRSRGANAAAEDNGPRARWAAPAKKSDSADDAVFSQQEPSADDLPLIEGYEIRGLIGCGGMGIVYKALQRNLNREVALKLLPALLGAANPEAVERFKREAASAARLRHRNIIPIYDFGNSSAGYYYSMEWVRGTSLDNVIRAFRALVGFERVGDLASARLNDDAPLPVWLRDLPRPFEPAYFRLVAGWMVDVCDALDAAHAEGIIHRDIKPGNLIVADDGIVKVADFGLARIEKEDTLTAAHGLMGTLRYASPEQLLGRHVPTDRRADIYSLGSTLFELLTLRPLFDGRRGEQLMVAIVGGDSPCVSSFNPRIPIELAAVCAKMLEKLPEHRYSSAGLLAEEFRAFLDGRPITARRAPWPRRTARFFRRHARKTLALTTVVAVSALAMGQIASERQERFDARSAEMVGQGLVFQQAMQWQSAAEVYRDVLRFDPDNIRALGNLAIVLKEIFNLQDVGDDSLLLEGTRLCDRALNLDSRQAGVWNIKGVLLKKLGSYERASAAYEQAIALSAEEPTIRIAAMNNLAEIQWLQGDPVTAESTLMASANLAEETETPAWYTWCDLASLQLSRQDPAAIESINRAFSLKAEPGWRLHLMRARIYLQLEGFLNAEQALRDVLAARERSRPDGRIKRVVAHANLRTGRYDEAIMSADEALALGDNPAFAHVIAAIAESNLANPENCRHRMALVKESWPQKLLDQGYVVSPERAMLWFDTAEQFLSLWREGEALCR